MSSVMGFESAPSEGGLQEKADPCTARKGKWEGTWLVLYCGGNAKIEQVSGKKRNQVVWPISSSGLVGVYLPGGLTPFEPQNPFLY